MRRCKSKIKRECYSIIVAALSTVVLASCGSRGVKEEDLIGTWISPYADNQKLEIRTEEIRFNYRTFDYEVNEDVLHLEETYPNHSITGDMPFELDGDTLTIELGDDFSGYFYGRSGQVELERQ